MSYITETRRCGMSDDGKKEPPRLHRVMVRCAESGEGVPTGMRIDPVSLKTTNAASTPSCVRTASTSTLGRGTTPGPKRWPAKKQLRMAG
jgi:hypothetical protein